MSCCWRRQNYWLWQMYGCDLPLNYLIYFKNFLKDSWCFIEWYKDMYWALYCWPAVSSRAIRWYYLTLHSSLRRFIFPQICHNNVCDSDKCTADGDCPQGFECESVCGYCEPKPGFCSSNNQCDNFDGLCDIENDPYTTCFWCDLTDNSCKPGMLFPWKT